MPLVDGTTDELAQVARAARAWREGAALQDIGRFATAHEAVAEAVRRLPSGLGRTSLGAVAFRRE
ncbi:hypothetical protein ACIGFK_40830 [Streptomyces sp. NPDC085524]|uniref:hypothetical protein n=1 Tax=unclassified Streptomyces TaxID=2593676 RepID=UPI0035DC0792